MPVWGGKLALPPKTSINKHKRIKNHSGNNRNLRYIYSVLNVAYIADFRQYIESIL